MLYDKRAISWATEFGGIVLPFPATIRYRNQRSWTPFRIGTKGDRARFFSRDWCGEVGWGSNDDASIGFITKENLRRAEQDSHLGIPASIPFVAVKFKSFWVFDDVSGRARSEGGEYLRLTKRDTLHAILDANGRGRRHAPKSFGREMRALESAAQHILREAKKYLQMSVRRDPEKVIKRATAEAVVELTDDMGRTISRHTRTDAIGDGGLAIQDYKSE